MLIQRLLQILLAAIVLVAAFGVLAFESRLVGNALGLVAVFEGWCRARDPGPLGRVRRGLACQRDREIGELSAAVGLAGAGERTGLGAECIRGEDLAARVDVRFVDAAHRIGRFDQGVRRPDG